MNFTLSNVMKTILSIIQNILLLIGYIILIPTGIIFMLGFLMWGMATGMVAVVGYLPIFLSSLIDSKP